LTKEESNREGRQKEKGGERSKKRGASLYSGNAPSPIGWDQRGKGKGGI